MNPFTRAARLFVLLLPPHLTLPRHSPGIHLQSYPPPRAVTWFTPTEVRGVSWEARGTEPKVEVAEFVFFAAAGAASNDGSNSGPVTTRAPRVGTVQSAAGSSAADAMLDDDSYTVWSSVVAESVVFDLGAATAVSAYSWKTGTQTEGRYDPIRWTLEGSSAAGGPWAMVDDRSYRSVDVTTARREFAVAAPQQRNVQCASCDQHNEGTFAAKAQLPMYVLDWETRKREGHFLDGTHHRDGVALELIFQLANSVGAAPWLCVHHLAGDGYVREMAGLALQLLRPDLKLYLEHSNEVWNQLFPQGAFATMHGRRLGLADGLTSTARGNGTCVSYTLAECARHRYHAMRSKRIFEIWKEVWGATGHAGRIVTVLSTHVAIPRTTRELLGWAGWGGNVSAHVDVVGVAGYFSAPSIKSAWAAHTAEMVHTAVRDHLPTVQSRLETQRGVAAEFGLKLITYEAGPALVQDDTIATGRSDGQVHEALIAASRHPGMEAVVSEGLTMVSTVTFYFGSRMDSFFVGNV